MPAGGRQRGAGHPTNHEQAAEQAAAAKTRTAAWKLPVISLKKNLETLQEIASGLWVEERVTTKTGEVTRRVYQQPPDRAALMFLIEQGGGRATQKQAVEQETRINIRPAFDWRKDPTSATPEPEGEPEEDDDDGD